MDRLSRYTVWNLFLAVLVLSSALAIHVLAGTPWLTIGAVLGGAVLLGAVLGLVVAPLSRRRMHNPTGHPFPVPFDAEQAAARREIEQRQIAALDWKAAA